MFLEYVKSYYVFCDYVNRTNTEDSHKELKSHMLIYRNVQFKVEEALHLGEEITEIQSPAHKTKNIINSKKSLSKNSKSIKLVYKSSKIIFIKYSLLHIVHL